MLVAKRLRRDLGAINFRDRSPQEIMKKEREVECGDKQNEQNKEYLESITVHHRE